MNFHFIIIQFKTVKISLISFLIFATFGTVASSEGCPTVSIIIGLLLLGLLQRLFKKLIGLGVWVKTDKPALCRAVIRKPVAIPTLSGT